MLIDKTDQTLGSVTYKANDDGLLVKIKKLIKDCQTYSMTRSKIKKSRGLIEKQVDHLERYGRHKNLEIHGVLQMIKKHQPNYKIDRKMSK